MDNAIRHCAYCLKSLYFKEMKECEICRKRSYCSNFCQSTDLSFPGVGQGHKYWCLKKCGEEDLDWEVSWVSGKGLGLIAKRKILAKERIIVDACRTMNHPAIKNLVPVRGTLEEKYSLNALRCGEAVDSYLCLRIARANHSCNPNADYIYNQTFNVVILFAEREISSGEEICISYQLHQDISATVTAANSRNVLKRKFGITCDKTCICYDEEREELILKSRILDRNINSFGFLALVDELLANQEVLKTGFKNQMRTLRDGLSIAMYQKKYELAITYGVKLYAIQCAIMSRYACEVRGTLDTLKQLSRMGYQVVIL